MTVQQFMTVCKYDFSLFEKSFNNCFPFTIKQVNIVNLK